jgi:hypothetical protein
VGLWHQAACQSPDPKQCMVVLLTMCGMHKWCFELHTTRSMRCDAISTGNMSPLSQECCDPGSLQVQVILEPASKQKQKTEVQACSAMVAGAPSRHVSAAFRCIVFAICVSCNAFHCGCMQLLVAGGPGGFTCRVAHAPYHLHVPADCCGYLGV